MKISFNTLSDMILEVMRDNNSDIHFFKNDKSLRIEKIDSDDNGINIEFEEEV